MQVLISSSSYYIHKSGESIYLFNGDWVMLILKCDTEDGDN